MLQVLNAQKRRIAVLNNIDDVKIEKKLSSGDKTLYFSYPKNGTSIEALKPENYIRTRDDEYVLKEIDTGEKKNSYVATLNIEELEHTEFTYGFESRTQTARDCLEFAFDGTGWKVGECTIEKRRTISIEDAATAWDVLQEVLDTYMCECTIDSLTKTVNIYEQIGSDKGAYFIEGMNLRKLQLKSDTYDFYTRIYPIGKDGITPQIILGVPYIDNHQYTDKVISKVWKDERYTVTENLIEDARAKLETASRPYTSYTAEVADLAAQSDLYDELDYDIGDTVYLVSKTERVKEKQRIVKITEYPMNPKKNTVELSNITKTFEQVQQETEEKNLSDAVDVSTNRTKKILKDGYWTKEESQAAISASNDEIKTTVEAVREEQRINTARAQKDAKDYTNETTNGVIEQITNQYRTELQQTQNAVNISVGTVEKDVQEQGNNLQEFKKEYETYFHFSDDGLEIGKKEDGGLMPFSSLLSDQRLEFRQDGNPVAYIQYNKLHIKNVEAVRTFSVGAAEDGGYFDFISTKYGMGVKWRAAEETTTATASLAKAARVRRRTQYQQVIDESGVFEMEAKT